jgi:hypothetical protein
MVGWKRIVVTVGEKIGKTHLTYAQGASAEIVAMVTIGLADVCGLAVSTTHVLSSGVVGTMAANGSGLQWSTIKNMALAWVLIARGYGNRRHAVRDPPPGVLTGCTPALLRRYRAARSDPDRSTGPTAITAKLSFTAAKPRLIRALVAARTDWCCSTVPAI